MPANWIVAAHGWGIPPEGALRKKFKLTEKFEYRVTMVPMGVEFVVYTPQNTIMGMDFGWDFWGALTGGLHGGEAGAYTKCHKSKGPGSLVPDYMVRGDTAFPTGVFEVCTNNNPNKVIDIRPQDRLLLSSILAEAKKNGVKRVYWGCCTQLDDTAPMENQRW
jgi:hypothetical protein